MLALLGIRLKILKNIEEKLDEHRKSKNLIFWSGNALLDPPCYDQFTDDDGDDGVDDDGRFYHSCA